MEFMNIGMISLITSLVYFSTITTALLKWTTIEKVQYTGFTPAWYMGTGRYICVLVFTSAIISNSADMNKYIKSILIRCLDRRCRKHVKRDVEDEDDDDVNTTRRTQNDLIAVYTGDPFNAPR